MFGSKGTDAVLSVEGFCCDRPNPFLQVSVLLIFLLWFISEHIESYCFFFGLGSVE